MALRGNWPIEAHLCNWRADGHCVYCCKHVSDSLSCRASVMSWATSASIRKKEEEERKPSFTAQSGVTALPRGE